MNTHRTIAAALVSTAVLVGGVGIATAQEAPADRPGLEALCARIPQVQERLENHKTRITGDAETQGSAAWLRARADQAEAEGHDRAADVLRNRADRREDRIEIIDQRLDRLARAADRCADEGLG